MLEVASEMLYRELWAYPQASVVLAGVGNDASKIAFDTSGGLLSVERVARGDAQFAILNPSFVAGLALKGFMPFKTPVPLRAIAVVPSRDQLVMTVAKDSPIRTLSDVARKQPALKLSLRATRDHSLQAVTPVVFAAAGFSLKAIEDWGGQAVFDARQPDDARRMTALEMGDVDAVFDEGVVVWLEKAIASGQRLAPIDEEILKKLGQMGFRRSVVPGGVYSGVPEDVPTLDFSGFLIYTHADVADPTVEAFCEGLELRKERIAYEEGDTLPLAIMCRDSPDGPLTIPLHPAAERFWRRKGYL